MKKTRKKRSAEFMAKVAREAVREHETLAQISRKYGINANVIHKWKRQLLENLARVFETEAGGDATEREAALLKKIGELTDDAYSEARGSDHQPQARPADITYIPMARGFGYLMAITDWYSRRVLSWRLSNALETSFCVEALREALARFGRPEIFNTDQGSQFTDQDFTGILLGLGVRVSMDGRGRCLDNIFVERNYYYYFLLVDRSHLSQPCF